MQRSLPRAVPEIRVGVRRTYATSSAQELPPIDSRWLSQTTTRIGKCMAFGLPAQHYQEAGSVVKQLATDWRELSAGSEGYLTGKGRGGLYKHKVVWGEQDSMSARVEWAANYARHIDPANRKQWEEIWSPRGTGMILRSIKTDFKFPMQYPDRVTVYHKLRELPEPGHDAFVLDVLMLSERHRRPVARAVEDIVMYDYRNAKKATLGQAPFMLEAFRETFHLQEEAAKLNREQAQVIEKKVRALETASWDREDAVEDFGGSK